MKDHGFSDFREQILIFFQKEKGLRASASTRSRYDAILSLFLYLNLGRFSCLYSSRYVDFMSSHSLSLAASCLHLELLLALLFSFTILDQPNEKACACTAPPAGPKHSPAAGLAGSCCLVASPAFSPLNNEMRFN